MTDQFKYSMPSKNHLSHYSGLTKIISFKMRQSSMMSSFKNRPTEVAENIQKYCLVLQNNYAHLDSHKELGEANF